jgi:2-iminobutanoate/2-iminopropanoate deaminase
MGLIVASSSSASSPPPTPPPPPAAAGPAPRAEHRAHHPAELSYCQAHEVRGATRWLFVSGQVPADAQGRVPPDFRSQCRLAWANLQAQLVAAGMSLDDLVKVTVFLADRRHRQDNYEVRHEVLGGRKPALTVIITGIYDEAWLLEIEAVAAA